MIALGIGTAIALVGVLTVVGVYKYKRLYKPGTARVVGVSFVAVVAMFGLWLLNELHDGSIPRGDALTFAGSIIVGLIVFFWLFKKRIDEFYYD